MDAPDITFKSSNGISASILRCPNDSLSENKSFLHVQNLRISGNKKNTISIDKAMIAAGNFNFQNGTGRIIGADSSYFASELHNVNLHPANNNQWNWSAGVAEANMRNLVINTTGKKNGRLLLKTAVLSNLNINETLGQDLKKYFKQILCLSFITLMDHTAMTLMNFNGTMQLSTNLKIPSPSIPFPISLP